MRITPGRLMFLKDFSTVVGIAINMVFLLFAKKKFHYLHDDIDEWVKDVMEYLGYVQGVSSGILIIFYTITTKKLISKGEWRKYVQLNRSKGKNFTTISNDERLDINQMSFEMTHQILMCNGPEAIEFNIN